MTQKYIGHQPPRDLKNKSSLDAFVTCNWVPLSFRTMTYCFYIKKRNKITSGYSAKRALLRASASYFNIS